MPLQPQSILPSSSRLAVRPLQGGIRALVVVLLALTGCQQQAADVSQIPHTPIPKTDAVLQLAPDGNTARYQGTVADQTTRDLLVRSVRSAYGDAASGELALDPDTNPPPWAPGLGELLPAFRMSGAVLEFRGKRIELGGQASLEDRANLLRTTRRLYPGYELAGLFQGVDMKHALPERGDTEALVAFLNAIPIAFQSDSGMVTPESLEGFNRAARAFKAAGSDARIEAGVYAEKTDSPDQDLQIAAQRADGVRLQLAIRGINPMAIQPRVLPAGGDKGGQVEFAALGPPRTDGAIAAQAAGKAPAPPEPEAD